MGKDFRHRRDGQVIQHKSGRGSQRHRPDKWKDFDEKYMRPEISLEQIEETMNSSYESKYRNKKN